MINFDSNCLPTPVSLLDRVLQKGQINRPNRPSEGSVQCGFTRGTEPNLNGPLNPATFKRHRITAGLDP